MRVLLVHSTLIVIMGTFIIAAAGKATASDADGVRLAAGDHVEVSVEKLRVTLRSKRGTSTSPCEDGPAGKLIFGSSRRFGLKCGQVYDGIVRLHEPGDDDPQTGLVVAYDWGDEGCLSRISSRIELTKDGKINVEVSTRNSGKQVGGTAKDCKPGLKRVDYQYDAANRKFEASAPAR